MGGSADEIKTERFGGVLKMTGITRCEAEKGNIKGDRQNTLSSSCFGGF